MAKKVPYTIACSSQFRNEILALAERQSVNVADIARSVLLLVPRQSVDDAPDPGEPERSDRELITDSNIESVNSSGKRKMRKPRLQVRLPHGFDTISIRKALGLALRFDRGEQTLHVKDTKAVAKADEEVGRLRQMIEVLLFDPLPDGVRTRADALHVLGFDPEAMPGPNALRRRYRELASVHHPDSPYGDHRRMAQVNEAAARLRV